MMKKLMLVVALLFMPFSSYAQDNPNPTKKVVKKVKKQPAKKPVLKPEAKKPVKVIEPKDTPVP